jgi:hypothetical protein
MIFAEKNCCSINAFSVMPLKHLMNNVKRHKSATQLKLNKDFKLVTKFNTPFFLVQVL